MKKFTYLFLLLLCSISFFSCGDDEKPELFVADDSIALPALRSGENDVLISHATMMHGQRLTTFTIEYDKSKKHALWVAYCYDQLRGQTNVERTDAWAKDPKVGAEFQRDNSDFPGNSLESGIDRGHICASSERLYSIEANQQTFYLTNISPQLSYFNRKGNWYKAEEIIRNWGRSCKGTDVLYVVKGGTIDDKPGHIRDYTHGDKTKPMPRYYFMAALSVRNGLYKSIAFLMNQDKPNVPVKDCVISVDELEEFTGFDFFHNLNDNIEKSVEAECNVKQWPGLN